MRSFQRAFLLATSVAAAAAAVGTAPEARAATPQTGQAPISSCGKAVDTASVYLSGHMMPDPPGSSNFEQDNRGLFGLASGTAYADALTGGAAMAVEHAPILLTTRDIFPAETARFVANWTTQPAPSTFDADVFGGPAAIAQSLQDALSAKIRP
ncbi:cell wall-binding repeat-containing protein [Catenulispora rubra]|uniref:cell wall-binding repeat-containing protein n=1 Tax=Catenulispora rubra TaxID=280293 RepID=UPI0018927651|nr:cell wall-binding repeat-containing protein [Catenulispora rubra]